MQAFILKGAPCLTIGKDPVSFLERYIRIQFVVKDSIKHFETFCRKYTAIFAVTFPSSCAVFPTLSEHLPVCDAELGRPG